MWRDVTAVSILRDDLTFLVSVSLIKYDMFSSTYTSPKVFQPFFPSASFYQKIQEFMQIQELPRISKVFTKLWIFLEEYKFDHMV